jgi:hypothetical protein
MASSFDIPLRRTEYEKLAELGAFENERIELLNGQLVRMSPIGPPHSSTVDQLTQLLVYHLFGRTIVRVQGPFAASDESEPEPDLALLPLGNYSKEHPAQAQLLIEVAEARCPTTAAPSSAPTPTAASLSIGSSIWWIAVSRCIASRAADATGRCSASTKGRASRRWHFRISSWSSRTSCLRESDAAQAFSISWPSMASLTFLATITPPASSAWFQFRPHFSRSISPLRLKPRR